MNDVSKGAIEERKVRLKAALGMISKLVPIEYVKAAGQISFNLGVSDNKAREYIKVLREAGQIEVFSGVVTMSKGGDRRAK